MSDPIAQDIADRLAGMEEQINRATFLLGLAEEAGEDVGTYRSRLRELEARRNRWKDVLKNRGYNVG